MERGTESDINIKSNIISYPVYYNLGKAHLIIEIITKLDAGEFEEEAQK